MSYSIYLIQSHYDQTVSHFKNLQCLITQEDKIILMGDAVLRADHEYIQDMKHIYVLESESLLLHTKPPHLSIINYNELAEYILNANQCVRLN